MTLHLIASSLGSPLINKCFSVGLNKNGEELMFLCLARRHKVQNVQRWPASGQTELCTIREI